MIEEDKRLGKDETIIVTLPYSKEKFGVPPNLYIIGTMNTADRSVEALDSALRRRFSFSEMIPNNNHENIQTKVIIGGIKFNFQEILATINQRLEKLVGRDHMIGHTYFLLGTDWKEYLQAFTNKIIPLLQEYFYGDWAKMCLVLGSGFVSLNPISTKSDLFASLPSGANTDNLDGLIDKEVWNLVPFNLLSEDTEMNFANALETLIGNTNPI